MTNLTTRKNLHFFSFKIALCNIAWKLSRRLVADLGLRSKRNIIISTRTQEI